MLFVALISIAISRCTIQTIYFGDEFDSSFCNNVKSQFQESINQFCEKNSNCLENLSGFKEPICSDFIDINDGLQKIDKNVTILTIFQSKKQSKTDFIDFSCFKNKIDVILYDNVLSSAQTSKQFLQQIQKIQNKLILENQLNHDLTSESIYKLYIKYLPPQAHQNQIPCGINGKLKNYVRNLYLLNGIFRFTDSVQADGIEFFHSQFDSTLSKTSFYTNYITFDVDSYDSYKYYSTSMLNLLSNIFSLRIHKNFKSNTIRIDYTSSIKMSLSYSNLSFPVTFNYIPLVSIISYPNVKQFSIISNCQKYSIYIDDREPIHYNFKNTNITVIPIESLNNQIILKSESAMNAGWSSELKSPLIHVNAAKASKVDVSKLSGISIAEDNYHFYESRLTINKRSNGYIFVLILFGLAMGFMVGINIYILNQNSAAKFNFDDYFSCYFDTKPHEIYHFSQKKIEGKSTKENEEGEAK